MQFSRGEIYNRRRAKQLRDFSGLRIENITATDIDGLIEYHGKGYIIIELKLRDTVMEFGQLLALERLTDDLWVGHKCVICIIASHDCDNPEEDIKVADAIVREYRFKGVWRVPQTKSSVKDIMSWFLEKKEFSKVFSTSKEVKAPSSAT